MVCLSLFTIHYEFIQKFNIPAQKAFAWCTRYDPTDMEIMQENATREVQYIADHVLILKDTFVIEGKSVEKQKLVSIYPNRLTWTSTHLTGPNKYSQFLYEISALSEGESQLRFTASSLDYDVENKKDAERQGKKVSKMDAENWKLLAQEMEKDLNQKNVQLGSYGGSSNLRKGKQK